jgi:hypothetical protein
MGQLVDSSEGDWMDVIYTMCHLPIANAYGYANNPSCIVDAIRSAQYQYRVDQLNMPFYVKYNRSCDGPLIINTAPPNLDLLQYQYGQSQIKKPLFALDQQPMVLLAGSIT